eukprot:6093988-Pleurochrysis_carterae.AAC.2
MSHKTLLHIPSSSLSQGCESADPWAESHSLRLSNQIQSQGTNRHQQSTGKKPSGLNGQTRRCVARASISHESSVRGGSISRHASKGCVEVRGAHCGYFRHEPEEGRNTSVVSWRILMAKLEHPRSSRRQLHPPGARDAKQALILARLWH